MKVLLTKDVPGLGRVNDVKEVSDGHARNFLIPRHLALPATTEVLTRVQKEEKEQQNKVQHQQEQAQNLKKNLESKTVIIQVKDSGTHKLYAAVREPIITEEINKKFHLSLTPKQVIIKQAIDTLGMHKVEIKLTETTHAQVKLEIKKQS